MKTAAAALTILLGSVVLLGCAMVEEPEEAPEPETVLVTVEQTVETTVERTVFAESEPEETTEASSSEIECEVNQECDLGESSVTVTSVTPTQSINTSLGDTFEGNFVVIEFDYTYGGSSPVDLDEPPFQITDENGATYSLSFEATSSYGIDNDRSLIYETVQPGIPTPGTAIIEVAPEAQGLTLLVSDLVSPQANDVARIPLGI